jgi:hypothetical protein
MYLGATLSIKENNKPSVKERLSLYELKQHKPWFYEKYLGILDKGKQLKMQWIQDPSQSNVDNLNVRERHHWEHNIEMNLQEVGCWSMDWIGLAQDRGRWWALVNPVMKIRAQ